MIRLLPLLYGLTLFLLIRLAVDIPSGYNYFAHTWTFIAIEITGVIVGGYLFFYLATKWIAYCNRRQTFPWFEYLMAAFTPGLLAVAVMALSHGFSLLADLRNLIIPLMITVLISFGIYLAMKNHSINKLYTESLLNEQKARTAETELELQLLRNQYHPHFLFNMLNTIYFTVDENNCSAREAIEHLSNLLRMQLYSDDNPCSVSREISVIESYVELSRLRYGDDIEVRVDIDRRFDEDLIFPHLLLPTVENAFKHLGGNERRVSIELKRNDNVLELQVENTVSARCGNNSGKPGLGLNNLKKRLEFLYPNRYILRNEITPDSYNSYLKIEL